MPHTNFSKYPLDIGIGIGIGISLGIGSIFSRFFQFGDHFFGEILVSFGHFLVLFWCLGTSWDIFGSLEGPGVPNTGTEDMLIVAPWLHVGSLFR